MLENVRRLAILVPITCLVLSTVADAEFLEKRSRVELRLGLWSQGKSRTEVGIGGVETTAEASNTVVSLAFGHWLRENTALMLSVSVLAAGTKTKVGFSGVSTHTAAVVPVLLGVRYYMPESTLRSSWRPYLAAGVGPYIGGESKVAVGAAVVSNSKSEAAFGGHLGVGLDLQLGRTMMVGANVGYNVMTDFSEPVGGRRNYSGAELGLGVSVLFGQGVQ
jgi:outer membrane protein W